MALEEWQHHIRHTHDEKKATAWCGAALTLEFAFVSIDHAVYTVEQEQRIQPCPACVDAVTAVLAKVDRG